MSLFVFQVSRHVSLTSHVCTSGGLLRKPPLKGAYTHTWLAYPLGMLTQRGYVPVPWTYGPVRLSACALCARPTYVCTKFVRTWGDPKLVHKVVTWYVPPILSHCLVLALVANQPLVLAQGPYTYWHYTYGIARVCPTDVPLCATVANTFLKESIGKSRKNLKKVQFSSKKVQFFAIFPNFLQFSSIFLEKS